MKKVFIALGGNVGSIKKNFDFALHSINKKIGKTIKQSSIYKTAPWGNVNQNDFLNMIVCVLTELDAYDVLRELLSIESELGRQRDITNRNAPRIIDLDILFYDNEVIHNKTITIPHPRLHLRNFVLIPFMEIEPDWMHPVLKKKIKDILAETNDTLKVSRL